MNLDKLAIVLGKIKDLKRQGWCNLEVSNPESVACHSYGVALLAYLLCPKELNKQKCIEYAIVHDLAEIIVGDITPDQNISLEDKHKKEVAAMTQISGELNCPNLLKDFEEYEAQETPEAKFVKELDRIDAILQAKYYDDDKRTDFYQRNSVGYKSLHDEFLTRSKSNVFELLEKIKSN